VRRGPLVGEPGAARVLRVPTGRPVRVTERRYHGSPVNVKGSAGYHPDWVGNLWVSGPRVARSESGREQGTRGGANR